MLQLSYHKLVLLFVTAILSFTTLKAQIQPEVLISQNIRFRDGIVTLDWKTLDESLIYSFEVEYSFDGYRYERLGFIEAKGSVNGSSYSFLQRLPINNVAFFRIKVTDIFDWWFYTDPITFYVDDVPRNRLFPTLIQNHVLSLQLDGTYESVMMANINGVVLLQRDLRGRTGRVDLVLPPDARGMFVVNLRNHNEMVTQKVMVQ